MVCFEMSLCGGVAVCQDPFKTRRQLSAVKHCLTKLDFYLSNELP